MDQKPSKAAALAIGGALNLYIVGVALGFVGLVFFVKPMSAGCTIDLGASCDGTCLINLGYCDGGGTCTAVIISNCYGGSCNVEIDGRCSGGSCTIVVSAALDYAHEPDCSEGCSAFITTTSC